MAEGNPDPLDPRELHARMDALTQANLRLLKRVTDLEQRVLHLESHEAAPAPVSAAAEPEAPLMAAPFEEAPAAFQEEEPERATAPGPRESVETPVGASVETAVGLNWLNRIGAFTLILGVAFFFKYAVDNDWIGPTARVLLGILAGFGLLLGGEQLRKRGHALYAQGISAAGVCVLYLTFWAAASLYKLIPVWFAFIALVADTALAGALAVRHRATVLAVLGLLGGYLTPIALSTGEYHPWIFYGFVFLLNAGWLSVARTQGWRVLDLIALPITLLLCGGMGLDLRSEDQGLAGTFAALSQYAVFIFSPIPIFPVVAQLAAGIAVGAAWAGHPNGFALPALALVAAGLCAAHVRRISELPVLTLGAFAAGYVLMKERVYPEPAGLLLLIAVAGFVILHAWLPTRLLGRHPITRADFALQPANAVFLLAAGLDLLRGDLQPWRGLFTAAMGGLYLATGYFFYTRGDESIRDRRNILLLAGVAVSLFTAAIAVQFESVRITVLWALEAAALAWISRHFDGWQGRAAAVIVAALAFVRLVGIDLMVYYGPLEEETLLLNGRFVTALVVALSLMAATWWLRPHRVALAPYLAGHLALLLGLGVEVLRQAARTYGADANSAGMVGITLLMAIYGLALVSVGVATRTRLNRLLGLGLLGLVIVKLYLVDVWTMRRIFRIVAFAGLGGLLLATSFLYSRFRTKIEALLNDEAH